MKQVFLRHKNGGGRIYGNDALVTASTFLDRGSSVGDDAEVYDSELISSVVTDHAVISGARIVDSYISGEVRVLGAVNVTNSTLSGQCRLWGDAKIADATLHNVFVFGDATVDGFSLSAFVRIHSGVWVSAPRFEILRAANLEITISECTEDRFHVGCFCRPWVTWARQEWRQRIGRAAGWPLELIEEGFQWFQTVA